MTDSTSDLWSACLSWLQTSMASAAFYDNLAGSTARMEDDTMRIRVSTALAAERCDARLRPVIERNLARLGYTGPIAFDPPSPPEIAPAPAPMPEADHEISVTLVAPDLSRIGWVPTSGYELRFWLPYLGRGPFCAWQLLRAFAYSAHRNGGDWPSLDTLAAILDTDRRQLTGRPDRAGWLPRLRDEQIIDWSSATSRRYEYTVLESLPLLTPAQASDLRPHLTQFHRHWLESAEVDLLTWSRVTVRTLCVTRTNVRVRPGQMSLPDKCPSRTNVRVRPGQMSESDPDKCPSKTY